MKKRYLLWAIVLGLGLTLTLFALLKKPVAPVRADPGIYYVRAGASGDCLSSTTPCGTIQQAIDLAGLPGDEVRVATGTYTENLIISDSVKLHGGWNITFTVRSIANTPTVVDGNADHVVRIDAPDAAVTLDGLVLTNGQDGIHAYSGTITVTACVVENFARQGIEIDGTPLTGTILLQHNHIRNGEREGIEIDLGAVTVLSNVIENVGRHGILVQGGEALIQGNVIQTVGFDPSADYRGIEVSGTHTIVGNVVRDVDERGIYVHDGVATIMNNRVEDAGGDGIRVDATCPSAEIGANTVYSTASDGIDTRAQTNVIAANTLTQTAKDGIHVEAVQDAQIRFNAIYSATSDGIDAEGTHAFTVIHNVINTTADGDGVKVTGAARATIRDNRIEWVGDDGVDARAVANVIARNVVADSANNGIKADGTTRVTVEANQIYGSGEAGIDLDAAGVFTLTNNVVADSAVDSVLVQTTAAPHNALYHNTLVGSPSGRQAIGLEVNVPGITLTLVNNIVVSHSIGISRVVGAGVVVSNSLLWANEGGTLVLSGTLSILQDPRFVDPPNRDYHLQANSPAIDAGADVGVSVDVDGDPRPLGNHPDIGADEFDPRDEFIYLPLVMRNYAPGVLLNPSFEGITCRPGSEPGWCLDNWTHETHDGKVHDNIFTPQGWVTW